VWVFELAFKGGEGGIDEMEKAVGGGVGEVGEEIGEGMAEGRILAPAEEGFAIDAQMLGDGAVVEAVGEEMDGGGLTGGEVGGRGGVRVSGKYFFGRGALWGIVGHVGRGRGRSQGGRRRIGARGGHSSPFL
jgi:hypothetical protein